VKFLLTPIDDVACFASVVTSGAIGLKARATVRVHLERNARDVEPLLRECPAGENTHKRWPSPVTELGRPLLEHFEEHRAGRTRCDAFRFAMK
jgi:hypothetical protein